MEELSGRGSRRLLGGADEREEKVGHKKVAAADIVEKANPGKRGGFLEKGMTDTKKKERKKKRGGTENEEQKGQGFSLRGLVGKRHSLVGCLRGRIVVRFLAHLAGESYFKVHLLCILRHLLMVCFSTLFLLILR